jgi:hypothetical protein
MFLTLISAYVIATPHRYNREHAEPFETPSSSQMEGLATDSDEVIVADAKFLYASGAASSEAFTKAFSPHGLEKLRRAAVSLA